MKTKKILGLSALTLATAAMAFAADTELLITGATAFRSSSHQAIQNYVNNHADWGGLEIYYVGGSVNGASRAIFRATSGSNPADTLTIKTSWSGSLAGIQALATGANVSEWLANSYITGTPGTYSIPASPTPTYVAAPANAALADNSQAETPYIGGTYTPLDADRVGAISFVWAKTPVHKNGSAQVVLDQITNITPLQAQLVTHGGAPASFFTKVPAHDAYTVLPLGRNSDSGTRLSAFAEIFLQPDASTALGSIEQYIVTDPTDLDGSGDIISLTGPVAATAGYSSGGTLAGFLGRSVASSFDTFLVSYLSLTDAASLPNVTFNPSTGEFSATNPALPFPILTFNGVEHSYAAVQEGKYSFWNYEYFLYDGSALTGAQQTVVDDLVDEITNNTASVSGLPLDNDFRVERAGAGQIITPL